jgi:Mg-chelatase subunit ChlD
MHEQFSNRFSGDRSDPGSGAVTAARRVRARSHSQGGFVLPTAAVFFIISLPIVGLVIDVGLDYLIQTKLQMAMDSAAPAGARSLSRGDDSATQITNAEATARSYLSANFPQGYLGVSTPTITSLSVNTTVANVRSVTITASATVPVMFFGSLGASAVTVGATATATRRDVNVMFVMDRSGSLQNSGSCAPLKNAATGFISKFSNGTDNVGLETFATSSRMDFPLATDFNTASTPVSTIINEVTCSGATNSAQALWNGYQALATLNQPAALNTILFFTDGQPTAVTANMPESSGSSCTTKGQTFTGVFTVGFQTASPFSPVATGGIMGYQAQAQPISSDNIEVGTAPPTGDGGTGKPAGCAFDSGGWPNNWTNAVNDITGVPTTDIWGNNLNNGYQSVTLSGGMVTVPSNSTGALNMIHASTNAADDASHRIQTSTTLSNILILTIGLGNSTYPANGDFLCRVANDPCSSRYSTATPTGLYVYAPTAADLSDAFSRVAAEILRLAK